MDTLNDHKQVCGDWWAWDDQEERPRIQHEGKRYVKIGMTYKLAKRTQRHTLFSKNREIFQVARQPNGHWLSTLPTFMNQVGMISVCHCNVVWLCVTCYVSPLVLVSGQCGDMGTTGDQAGAGTLTHGHMGLEHRARTPTQFWRGAQGTPVPGIVRWSPN